MPQAEKPASKAGAIKIEGSIPPYEAGLQDGYSEGFRAGYEHAMKAVREFTEGER